MKSILEILVAAKAKQYEDVYPESPIIMEVEGVGLHPEIENHLNTSSNPNHVFNSVTKSARNIIKRGETTGLAEDKPKKGSSRAVFFPKNPHKITLDGNEAHVHSVVKIAFPGHLDKYNKSGSLLGQHQNQTESDYFAQSHWGIIRPTQDHKPNSYETNHERGVLAPVFDSHPDDHWLHMGRVRPVKKGEFRELTKTKEFPKGISHQDMFHTLMHHHEECHGRTHYGGGNRNYDKLSEHPFIHNMNDFVQTMGQHPGDYATRNMGVFEHPSGSKHLVISDYGFSHTVAKHYNDARKNMIESMRRNYR